MVRSYYCILFNDDVSPFERRGSFLKTENTPKNEYLIIEKIWRSDFFPKLNAVKLKFYRIFVLILIDVAKKYAICESLNYRNVLKFRLQPAKISAL